MTQKENDNNYQNQQGYSQPKKKKKTGLKILLGIVAGILVIAAVILALNWKRIANYLQDKKNGKINEIIQYDLTVPDNAWIDERYANGFGEKYEVKGRVIAVSTDGNTIVTITDYSDGQRVLLYDLQTGQLIKEFEGEYSYPFTYRVASYITNHVPLVTRTETNTELRYLDLENMNIYTLLRFKLYADLDVIAFDSSYDFIIGMSFMGEDGNKYYSYAAYIDLKFAWATNFGGSYTYRQANSDYLFLSLEKSTYDKKYLTIIDRKNGKILLENKEIDTDLTVLQDGFITTPGIDYSEGISFQDITESGKKIHKVYDVRGNELGEIIGYPHMPWYPTDELGGYVTTANVLNEDVKKASGIVYLINAEGKVVAYEVFIGNMIFPITGSSINKYMYTDFYGCTKDGSIIIAQKIGQTMEEYAAVVLDNKFNVIDECQTGLNSYCSTISGIVWGDNVGGTSWVLPPKGN